MMSPIFRLYRSGTKLLIRSYIDVGQQNNIDKCLAYNESKLQVSLDTVEEDTPIIPLVLFEGIKFTTKSFEIVIKLVQIMVLDKLEDHSQVCLIKHNNNNPVQKDIEFQNQNNDDNTSNNYDVSDGNIKEEVSPINIVDNTENYDINSNNSDNYQVSDANIKEEVSPINTIGNIENDDIIQQNNDNDKMSTEDKSLENLETLEHILEVVEERKEEPVIEEIEINVDDTTEILNLKRPNEVYYEIYKSAREKAKHMRKVAIEAFLEAKDIKKRYMLEDIDESDEEEDFNTLDN